VRTIVRILMYCMLIECKMLDPFNFKGMFQFALAEPRLRWIFAFQKSKCILTPSSEVLFSNPNRPVNNAYWSRQQTHRQSRPRGVKGNMFQKPAMENIYCAPFSIRCSSGLSPQMCPGRKRLDSPWNTVWEVNTQGRKSSRGSDKLFHIPLPIIRWPGVLWGGLETERERDTKREANNKQNSFKTQMKSRCLSW